MLDTERMIPLGPHTLALTQLDGWSMLTMFNTNGFLLAVEELGYLLMSFALAFLAPVFMGRTLEGDMSVLVNVESPFGNTRQVADAAVVGLREVLVDEVVEVAQARDEVLKDVVRLLREWIQEAVPRTDVDIVTSDTRVRVPGMPGSAARSAAKAWRQRGFRKVERGPTF